jgi:uncharacterized protein YqhQ
LDFSKIFIKDANPTKIGGQAVIEGIMMKGEERTATAIRLPDGSVFVKTEKPAPRSKAYNIPILRGILIFVASLVSGVKTLTFSAEILEKAENEGEALEKDKLTLWLEKRFGEKGAFSAMLYFSVVIALAFTVVVFIIGPTWIVDFFKLLIKNEIVLNLIEGVFRILLFVLYIALISKMRDIQTVFQYHGAEHECIHCFESGLPLLPENCQKFETLHPRCGTSFLMFVMVISLLLFSLLGWKDLLFRIASRLLLIPVIAGLSYELLRWAGSSTSPVVKVLSVPGLLLQKLTTRKPNDQQLEVAIIALIAARIPASEPDIEGTVDAVGRIELIRKLANEENGYEEALNAKLTILPEKPADENGSEQGSDSIPVEITAEITAEIIKEAVSENAETSAADSSCL